MRSDIDDALASLGARRGAATSPRSPRPQGSDTGRSRPIGTVSSDPLVIRTGVTREWEDGTTWTIQHAVTAAGDTSGWAVELALRGRLVGQSDVHVRVSQWDRVPGGGWRFHRAPPVLPRTTLLRLADEAAAAGMLDGPESDVVLEETATFLLCSLYEGFGHAYRTTRLDGDLVRLRWEYKGERGWMASNAAPTIPPGAMRRVIEWLR